jgi:ADP-ribosylglycohydrolase
LAPGFQIRATDAVAAALLALTCHWEHPEDALTAAVHYGGDTDTIAAMVGALAGALHGTAWLPQRWLQQLENQGPEQGQLEQPLTWSSTGGVGRDAARHLALALAQVDAAEW